MSVLAEAACSLRVLVVDDEAPARSELAYLLSCDTRISSVRCAASAAEALEISAAEPVDAVFCDIKMPGMDGIALARILGSFAHRPQIVFVTAYDEHAVDAFELRAVDYVMKPVRAGRVAEAVRRLYPSPDRADDPDETVPVELAGVTRFVRRSQVRFVEAQGDYARLHTAAESHLVRMSLATLEQRWPDFVRIHRSTLVSLAHVRELRMDDGRCTVGLDGVELAVSRRHTRELRERLMHRSSPA
ncbi:two component transcriptional regulator, LytTR family [Modestobacter sp. DSM 44400]|uniref:LytR/AlgR family response regulator transcription factor n=1 Tax=Modestobacter sp. DSM 44400 TaxID=1550230 RepID=UPI00089D2FE1|nr:LytTR family DNA-binding domain-containing protein [Modestobacter sp. DSM 44400]SDX58759.1 two component transcriptional regulator, LytTR family [Modestobacter sp. DSM 44400]